MGSLRRRGVLAALMLVLTLRLLAVDYPNIVRDVAQTDAPSMTLSDCDSRESPYLESDVRNKFDLHPAAPTNRPPDLFQTEPLTGHVARASISLLLQSVLCSLGLAVPATFVIAFVLSFVITFVLVLAGRGLSRLPEISLLVESHVRFLYFLVIPLFFGLFVNQGATARSCLNSVGAISWMVTQENFLTMAAIAFWLALTELEVRRILNAVRCEGTPGAIRPTTSHWKD
jgi:hypothetical protein